MPQEFNSDEYAASCYWGFAGSNTGGGRHTSSRRTSLQPLSEAPWLLNAEVSSALDNAWLQQTDCAALFGVA